MRFRGQVQIDRCTRRCAVGDQIGQVAKAVLGWFAGGENDVDNVVFDFVVDVDFPQHLSRLENLSRSDHF